MMKFVKIITVDESLTTTPETKLWCAVLKRALDDVNHYPPDHKHYLHAFEWLTVPGDENISGTLSNVVNHITQSKDHQDTVIKEIQGLVFSREKLDAYKRACLIVKYNRPSTINKS